MRQQKEINVEVLIVLLFILMIIIIHFVLKNNEEEHRNESFIDDPKSKHSAHEVNLAFWAEKEEATKIKNEKKAQAHSKKVLDKEEVERTRKLFDEEAAEIKRLHRAKLEKEATEIKRLHRAKLEKEAAEKEELIKNVEQENLNSLNSKEEQKYKDEVFELQRYQMCCKGLFNEEHEALM